MPLALETTEAVHRVPTAPESTGSPFTPSPFIEYTVDDTEQLSAGFNNQHGDAIALWSPHEIARAATTVSASLGPTPGMV